MLRMMNQSTVNDNNSIPVTPKALKPLYSRPIYTRGLLFKLRSRLYGRTSLFTYAILVILKVSRCYAPVGQSCEFPMSGYFHFN